MIYSSFYWKQKARTALKGQWQTALLICLVVNLPSLLTQGIAAVTGHDLMSNLQTALYASVSAEGALDAALFQTKTQEILQTPGTWILMAAHVLAWLMIPCLAMGMYAWMMKRLRGEEGTFTDVFSRTRLFLKAMGLRLYVTLRIFLFMLPGVVLSVLSLLPLWLADSSSRLSVLSAANTSMGLTTVSSFAMAILGVIGMLHYALADLVMTDQTGTGIRAAARRGRELMKGRKMQLFSLYLSFILWYILEILLTNLVAGMFGTVAGLMMEMLCSLAISVYLYTSVCAFYITLLQEERGERTEEESEADEAEEEPEI